MAHALIHFHYADPTGKIISRVPPGIKDADDKENKGYYGTAIACDPTSEVLPKHASSLCRAVTCPNCQKTDRFKQELLKQEGKDQDVAPEVLTEEDINKMLTTVKPVVNPDTSSPPPPRRTTPNPTED